MPPPTCAICNWIRPFPDDFTLWPQEVQEHIDIYPITEYGKPTRRLKGYICARCLHEANEMRIYIKSIMQGVQVTKHAIDRFMERHAGEHMSDETSRVAIIKIFSISKPIRFKNRFMVQRFLNNRHKAVRYTYAQGFIFVVAKEEPPVILTIEATLNRKLNEDFWYEEENPIALSSKEV